MANMQSVSLQLDRLAAVEAGPYPVISLYLNLQPNDRGRDDYGTFVRDTLTERLASYPADGPERQSLEEDRKKITAQLEAVDPASNGIALFASSGAGLFEVLELHAPIASHQLHISSRPHLYPLARVLDEYRRHAVLVADSQSARLFVAAATGVERADAIESTRTKRHKAGGWSQARYQRHVDNFRAQHIKEVADVLTRVVRDEQMESVVIGGDDVITAHIRTELPKDVAERVIDLVRLDARAPEHEVLQRALESLQQHDTETDRERVDALLDAYRAGGLGTVGVKAVTRALELGQVNELLITASSDAIDAAARGDERPAGRTAAERVADALVVSARQTGASIRFIQDAQLLEPYGGVGAFLRFLV